ncbi:SUMF1/EgtB/PvdO family nonheme iron enzyme [bacterium]|nr:SUMF1/EgtB/PvdO family nonheme iron enzyme [bacterium]
MESFHFSRSGVRELEIIPRIFLSNQYQFQEFDKLFKLYIENETNNTPSVIDSMLHYYQGDQFRAAYDEFVSLRLIPQNQYVTLKALLKKLSPYVLTRAESDGMSWCDSILGSLNKEIERATKIDEENTRKAIILGDKLQKVENNLEALRDEFDRINNFDEETNSLKNRVESLKHKKNKAYGEDRMTIVSGYIVKLYSQTGYSNIYECSDNQGYHFLLETFNTSFNSQGSFSLYAEKEPDVPITTVNGFQQDWAKWAEVSNESYYEYIEDRVAIKEELAESKQLLDKRIRKAPVNIDEKLKTLKQKITEKSLALERDKSLLAALKISTDPILYDYVSRIPGGSFIMGNSSVNGEVRDSPAHKVYIDGFYMGRIETTINQYLNFLNDRGVSPSGTYNNRKLINLNSQNCPIIYDERFYFSSNKMSKAMDHPVTNVTWYGAVEYCNWLSEKVGKEPAYTISDDDVICDWTANGYRLPTEAEWEYAAKGDRVQTILSGTNADGKIVENSSSSSNNSLETHSVGTKQPNTLGLYDMRGNVMEWCWDWYDRYSAKMETNPRGALSGLNRITRGGSFKDTVKHLDFTHRKFLKPQLSNKRLGFRIARAN